MTREEAIALARNLGVWRYPFTADALLAVINEAYMLGQKDGGEWRAAIEDAAVAHWTLSDEHTPRQALAAVIHMAEIMVLDPSISGGAQALIERGRTTERTQRRAALDELARIDQALEKESAAKTAPTLERINTAHSRMTKAACEKGADHGADLGFPHREYAQSSDEACYICTLLEQVRDLKSAAQQVPEAARPGNDGYASSTPAAPPLCVCKDRPLEDCPGEWEPGCDLGNSATHVRAVNMSPLGALLAGETQTFTTTATHSAQVMAAGAHNVLRESE
jgi:hypothetical protein